MPRGRFYRLATRSAILSRTMKLKIALNRKLMGLAADGVIDPIELREWALEGLPR